MLAGPLHFICWGAEDQGKQLGTSDHATALHEKSTSDGVGNQDIVAIGFKSIT